MQNSNLGAASRKAPPAAGNQQEESPNVGSKGFNSKGKVLTCKKQMETKCRRSGGRSECEAFAAA
jgi:hypothetical protein